MLYRGKSITFGTVYSYISDMLDFIQRFWFIFGTVCTELQVSIEEGLEQYDITCMSKLLNFCLQAAEIKLDCCATIYLSILDKNCIIFLTILIVP